HQLEGDNLPTAEELENYLQRFDTWLGNTAKVRDWYQWCAFKKDLASAGMNVVSRKVEKEEISGEHLCDGFFKALFKSLACEKIAQSSTLRTFEGSIFDETVARYQKLTREFQILSQKELYARLAANIPHVTENIDSSSEIGLLNRNISNGGRGLSLRDLMDQIPTLLPRLCPVMLMSPMSVAQYLNLSQDKFDLVVFDEASQMPTSEAVGAIARGKSVIVVGDPKQMPPTSFFNSTNVTEEEADIDDMESILEDCRTLEIPALQLNWHYRSKHESLIAFSNNEYYEGQLITFPSTDDQATMVKYNYVDGVYDKGGCRSNPQEAQAIVEEIAKRLQAPNHADRSIGVIAFSVVQQNLIEDMLIEKLESDKALHEAAEELYEPIFVKNLENVQGDERDIIMFSIGYGPDKEGKVSMNFGPLNNSGGERRLNVAVTRARREMVVFSSLKASQIDLRRTKARGVEGLKHFLEYAEQQVLTQTDGTKRENMDNILSEQIAKALRERGYEANTQIGRSNFKVDVAIADANNKERYTLGILLDGEGYHDTQTTRDREIVQPSVLKGLGWKIMRVWSADWINNPERVLERIETYLKENAPAPEPEKKEVFDVSKEEVIEAPSDELEYKVYTPKGNVANKSDKQLAGDILNCEQPMTLSYLCRRIATLREMPRVTQSLTNTVTEIAENNFCMQQIGSSTIVWKDLQSAKSFKGYRKNNGRDITDIPVIEVMNAIVASVREQFSIRTDALTLIVAKQLGFTRRGAKVDQALNEALQQLLLEKKVVDTDGMLRLPE
ncbi:MAG: AAA domain-containing protein, partial [Bacteroidales bacterium]|nr:AAA domain-containing protein [Bacteroidales bacterium]